MKKVQHRIVSVEDQNIRLDRWFQRFFPTVPHFLLEKLLRKGQVRVGGKRVKASYRVQAQDEIRIPPMEETVAPSKEKAKKAPPKQQIDKIKNAIIYNDKNLFIINKPPGFAVQGGSGIYCSVDDVLPYLFEDPTVKPKLVHRLDKDTSGILVVAKNATSAAKLTEAFRSKSIHKTYLAITLGKLTAAREGEINLPLSKGGPGGHEKMFVDQENGQSAKTAYKVLEMLPNYVALMRLSPITGRTHQLRVHLQAIGVPILGDGKYGGKEVFLDGLSKKMSLHAYHIALPKLFGKKITVTAPLPLHMKENFATLEFELPDL
jgi:23S rRNA pseudouridine955/2504/2580 synthase